MHSKTKGDKNVRGRNPKIVLYDAAIHRRRRLRKTHGAMGRRTRKKAEKRKYTNALEHDCGHDNLLHEYLHHIASIKYHLSCNPNCDSAIYDKVAKLQSQEGILQQKYLEFQQNKDKKDNYTVQTNINRDVSIFNLDRAV